MHEKRTHGNRVAASAVALGALVLVGLGPTGAAYADKPAAPPEKAQPSAPQHRTSGTAGTSGEATSPQPRSTADGQGTGANQPGSYDSTRDGSPSRNGNGGGQATGKPCAGCVGKADNKNPPGQAPDGSDRNAGYECDRNKGIGRTNPAHTGCTVSQPPPTPEEPHGPEVPPGPEEPEAPEQPGPEQPQGPEQPGPEQPGPEQPQGPCVDLPGTTEDECGEVLAPPAGPRTPGDTLTTPLGSTSGEAQAAPTAPEQAVAGAPTERAAAATLPATGAASGVLLTALAGLLLLAAGVVLTRLKSARVRA